MAGQWASPGGGVISSLYSGRHVVQILCDRDGKAFSVVLPDSDKGKEGMAFKGLSD